MVVFLPLRTAKVTELSQQGENWWLSVRLPESLHGYVVEKGSIAIDGISLTVARVSDGVAEVEAPTEKPIDRASRSYRSAQRMEP